MLGGLMYLVCLMNDERYNMCFKQPSDSAMGCRGEESGNVKQTLERESML